MQEFAQQTQSSHFSEMPQTPNRLKSLLAFMKRHLWLTIAGIFLLISAVVLLLTPSQEVVTNVPAPAFITKQELPEQLKTIRYTGPTISIPEEVTIFAGSGLATSLQTIAESIADSEQLSKITQSTIENLWTNAEGTTTLDIRDNNQKLVFVRDIPQTNTSDSLLITTNAVAAANKFITESAKISDLSPQTEQIKYQAGETEASSLEASSIIIPYTYSIEGIPVRFGSSFQTLARVFINKDYVVTKAELFPPLPSPTTTSKAKPISIESAIEQIKNENAQIISAGSSTGYDVKLEDITELELKTGFLEYRFDLENKIFYPYYAFSGIGRIETDQTQSYNITIITPAIKTAAESK